MSGKNTIQTMKMLTPVFVTSKLRAISRCFKSRNES